MKTKHAREIRKGIRFANQLHHAILITENTRLRHVYWGCYDTWQHTAPRLAIKAFWRTMEPLQETEFVRLLNQLYKGSYINPH